MQALCRDLSRDTKTVEPSRAGANLQTSRNLQSQQFVSGKDAKSGIRLGRAWAHARVPADGPLARRRPARSGSPVPVPPSHGAVSDSRRVSFASLCIRNTVAEQLFLLASSTEACGREQFFCPVAADGDLFYTKHVSESNKLRQVIVNALLDKRPLI